MAYKHTNSKGVTYYLHKTEVTLRGGKPQTIYFFTKVEKNEKGEPCDLPDDRVVKEINFAVFAKTLGLSAEGFVVAKCLRLDSKFATLDM